MINLQKVSLFHKFIFDLSGKENVKENEHKLNNELYHYTSVKVLDSILYRARFWASNIYYLNDSTEYYSGISLLKDELINKTCMYSPSQWEEVMDEIEQEDGKSFPGIFTISFTGLADNLHQWVTYARESGVCIQMDKDILTKSESIALYYEVKTREAKEADKMLKYENASKIFLPINYGENLDEDRVVQLIENIVKSMVGADEENYSIYKEDDRYSYSEEFRNECMQRLGQNNDKPKIEEKIDENLVNFIFTDKQHAQNFLKLLSTYYKNDSFKQEEEVRASFLLANESKDETPKIQYQCRDNGIIRPYIEIEFRKKSGLSKGVGKSPRNVIEKHAIIEPKIPIQSITIGPSGKQQAIFDSVVHRIKYGENKVWDYVLDSLDDTDTLIKRYNDYINGVFAKGITISSNGDEKKQEDEKEIEKFLFLQWIKLNTELGNERIERIKMMLEAAEKRDSKEKCSSENCKRWNSYSKLKEIIDIESNCNGNQEIKLTSKLEEIINNINQSNFFSKEGIWIKKSKIPYIFE